MNLIMLDVDGCILDADGAVNMPLGSLAERIAMYRRSGVRFGLNSNRGVEDVLPIAAALGCDGPHIIERGAAILHADSTTYSATYSAVELIPPMPAPDGCVMVPVRVLKAEGSSWSGAFADDARRYSLSIYCRKDGAPDIALADSLVDRLGTMYPGRDVWRKANGHVWCLDRSVDKGTAIRALAAQEPSAISMIGHDDADVPAFEAAAYSAAPSNIQHGLKADYVSPYALTRGVADCIDHIMDVVYGGRI